MRPAWFYENAPTINFDEKRLIYEESADVDV
jgi:hypothetical protein